jgi:hypothetical protein
MAYVYFEKLNHHTICIDLPEARIRKIYSEYLVKEKNPDFLMFCVLLAKKGIDFYSITEPSKELSVLKL